MRGSYEEGQKKEVGRYPISTGGSPSKKITVVTITVVKPIERKG